MARLLPAPLTVRTCAPASARTCGAGSGSGSTFLVGSPCRSSPAGAWTVIQENKADSWARWLLTVAGAIAAAAPSRPVVPSAARWSRQAATSRGGDGGDPVVPEPGGEPAGESPEVPLDLPGHLLGPYVVLLGVGEGQAGMAGTDRAPVLLLSDRRFVTDGESSAVATRDIRLTCTPQRSSVPAAGRVQMEQSVVHDEGAL